MINYINQKINTWQMVVKRSNLNYSLLILNEPNNFISYHLHLLRRTEMKKVFVPASDTAVFSSLSSN